MPAVDDPSAIRQWVACIGLVLEAESASHSGSAVDRAIALITADTALESMLALLSSRSLDPLDTHSFGTYLKRAASVAKMSDRDEREIQAVHKIRNGVIHSASDVSADDVRRATAAARNTLDTYVPRVLKRTKALGRGSGIGDAVASLIEPHPVAHHLREAQQALNRRDPAGSLVSCARAFTALQAFARPSLPWIARGGLPIKDRVVAWNLSDVRGLVHQLEAWVVPLAMGMSAATLAALRTDLPRLRGGDQTADWSDPEQPAPGLESARRSVERISSVALRFWLSESLKYPRPDRTVTNVWDEISGDDD